MAVAFVQKVTWASGNPTITNNITGVSKGDLLIVVYRAYGATGAASNYTLTDSTGQTWFLATRTTDAANFHDMWYLPNANAGTHTVGFSVTGGFTFSVSVPVTPQTASIVPVIVTNTPTLQSKPVVVKRAALKSDPIVVRRPMMTTKLGR